MAHKDQFRGGLVNNSQTAVSYTKYQAMVLGMARMVNGRFRHSCHAKIKNNIVKSPAANKRSRGSG